MDQVFADVLNQDEMKKMHVSMTAGEEVCYLGLDDVFSSADEISNITDPCLRKQRLSDVVPEPSTPDSPFRYVVPLAQLEEFSEENTLLTEDDLSNLASNGSRLSHISGLPCGDPLAPDGESPGSPDTRDAASGSVNGPGVAATYNHQPHQQHIIDVNGNGTAKSKQWLNQPIECYDDLQRMFVDNGVSGDEDDQDDEDDITRSYDFVEFADRYFNVHYSNTGYHGAISKTVSIVRRKSMSEVSSEDLTRYTKNSTLPTSLIQLLNPNSVAIACSIFKDLCKYMKGEFKGEACSSMLRSLVDNALEHIELRDEIYCQLCRQTRENTHQEQNERAWTALSLCSVSFSPSKTLKKYLVAHLKQNCDASLVDPQSRIARCAAYCLRHTELADDWCRKLPPCLDEIEAVSNLQPMVYRIYFLDGKTKAIALEPHQKVIDALLTIQDKIGLISIHGWALFESTPERDRHMMDQEYMADILSAWERKQKIQTSGAPGTPKKSSIKISPVQSYGQLVFCKRIYDRVTELPSDPTEHSLLYAEAIHHVVRLDDFGISVAAAIHLAGIQAQVEYGNFDDTKLYRYTNPEDFLCQRVLLCDHREWAVELAAAHKRHGQEKGEMDCKMKYLFILSQHPLYGCTKIFAHYQGMWTYGRETVLALNYDGVKFISIEDKMVTFDFYYAEIEKILLEERNEEYYVLVQLKNFVSPHRQKCFMFECLDLEDISSLLEHYSKTHATIWKQSLNNFRKRKIKSPSDWLKLYTDILGCRRTLVQTGVMHPPTSEGLGIIRTALNRISGRNSSRDDESIDIHGPYWSFSKVPFKLSLMVFDSHEVTDVASRMFNSTLVYTGIESAAILEDMDLVVVVQTLIIKCMENDDLCNEFYLQLIKQTTDTQADLIQRAGLRYWHLMTMATSVMLPPNQLIFQYLNLHLRRYAVQKDTEEGAYAQFCIKSLFRTYESKGRKYPPSFKEIEYVTKRRSIEVRIHLADARQMLVEFDSATSCLEVMNVVKAKTGMRLDSEGYGLYEVFGEKEGFLSNKEKLADSLYRWEGWAKSNNASTKDLRLFFRKRIFVEPVANLNDPVEVDLLYHQSVTDVFEQKIPLTKFDATELCALRAQAEYGDFGHAASVDYSSVMRILPRHLRDLMQVSEVAVIHKTLAGTPPMAANIEFLSVLKHWPLYGATVYEVTQTSMDILPKSLWLAVSQIGIHIMEFKGQNIYYTYPYKDIMQCNATSKNLSLIIGDDNEGPSLLFYSSQGNQIVQLIEDYQDTLEKRRLTPSKSTQVFCKTVSCSQEHLSKETSGIT